MHITRSFVLGLCFLSANGVFAEENPRATAKVDVKKSDAKKVDKALAPSKNDRIWVNAEYVALWTRKAPQPDFPLLTLGNDNQGTAQPGALGDPATSIFYQPKDHGYGVHHGFNVSAGGWITADKKWGAEIGALWTPKQSDRKTIYAPLNVPGLSTYRPFFDMDPNSTTYQHQFAFLLGGLNPATFTNVFGPGTYPAVLKEKNEEQYWSGNFHGLYNVVRDKHWSATALLGFAYHSLDERYQVDYSGFTPEGIRGMSFSTDKVETNNKFYGADLGMKFEFNYNRFRAEITPKLAIGNTYQHLSMSGVNTNDLAGSTITGGTPYIFQQSPGGFWVQATNTGGQTRNIFTVLPSLEAKIGVKINRYLDFNVGYTGMYWNHVAHPGNQLDFRINGDNSSLLTINTVDGEPHFSGNQYPVRKFKDSEFWAQGVTAGFKVKF